MALWIRAAVECWRISCCVEHVTTHHDRCYDLLHELLVQGVVPEHLVVVLACEIGHHSEADIRSSLILQHVSIASSGSHVVSAGCMM